MERIGVVGWNQETNIELVQAWCDPGLHARALALAPSAVAA
jgi:hypothetical protein